MDERITQNSDMGVEKLECYKNIINNLNLETPSKYCLEVGTRKGGTSILALLQPQIKVVISIDPYGAKPYYDEHNKIAPFVYDDQMEIHAQIVCNQVAQELSKFFTHFKMTSLDFLNLDFDFWLDGNAQRIKDIKFDYVLLDGDHRTETVLQEVELLKPRMNKGGVIAIDNIDWMDTKKFNDVLEYPRNDIAFITIR